MKNSVDYIFSVFRKKIEDKKAITYKDITYKVLKPRRQKTLPSTYEGPDDTSTPSIQSSANHLDGAHYLEIVVDGDHHFIRHDIYRDLSNSISHGSSVSRLELLQCSDFVVSAMGAIIKCRWSMVDLIRGSLNVHRHEAINL